MLKNNIIYSIISSVLSFILGNSIGVPDYFTQTIFSLIIFVIVFMLLSTVFLVLKMNYYKNGTLISIIITVGVVFLFHLLIR